jgi:hypothetical protein
MQRGRLHLTQFPIYEPVPDPPDVPEQSLAARVVESPPQPAGMAVERPRPAIHAASDGAEQILASEHAGRLAGQVAEQPQNAGT